MFMLRSQSSPLVLTGMDKSGNQAITTGTTNAQLTGWTSRSGFTANIVSDKLVVSGSGTAQINAHIRYSGQSSNPKIDLMRTRAGVDTQLSTQTGTAFQTDLDYVLAAQSLLDGDALWFRASASSGFTATITGGVNTYIYLS